MTRFKKWTIIVLAGSLAAVGLAVSINTTVDAYGIMRRDFTRQLQEPNMRFIKVRHLLENKERYDSFLFGSSRALQIDTNKIRGGNYYNMGYSEGLPKEHLEIIRFLLQNGIQIKNLIITLDDFSCRVDSAWHGNDLLRQQHFLISGKSKRQFYGEYYVKLNKFFPQLQNFISKTFTREGREEAGRVTYDLCGSGRESCISCDREIEENVAKHVSDKKFGWPYHYDGNNLEHAMEDMTRLVDLAKREHINLTVVINPSHHGTYLDTDLPLFNTFKKRLAGVTSYYDFSGLNTITKNNYYYYETSHFRQMVGDMMLYRMFGYPVVSVPDDFGVLVTAENVDRHIAMLRQQIDANTRTAGAPEKAAEH